METVRVRVQVLGAAQRRLAATSTTACSRSVTARARARSAPARSGKNYHFGGSNAGGERAAMFYGLLNMPKLNELDPEAYLRTVAA